LNSNLVGFSEAATENKARLQMRSGFFRRVVQANQIIEPEIEGSVKNRTYFANANRDPDKRLEQTGSGQPIEYHGFGSFRLDQLSFQVVRANQQEIVLRKL